MREEIQEFFNAEVQGDNVGSFFVDGCFYGWERKQQNQFISSSEDDFL